MFGSLIVTSHVISSPTCAVLGVAVQLRIMFGELVIVRLKLVVFESGEPVTVIEYVPATAEGKTVKVAVKLHGLPALGTHPWLEKPTETSLGSPDAERVTA